MDEAQVVIVGGGVVGCAIAAELAAKHEDVFLLEQMPHLGMGASSRNSGVLHSGIYYPLGSLKARHCVEGNRLTYEFCAAHNVPHRYSGKLVVATGREEEPVLEELLARGRSNGVPGLELITTKEIRKLEPHIAARAALRAPSTGLVDSDALVKAFARLAVERGASILTDARLEAVEPGPASIHIHSTVGDIETRALVNAAGLFADEVAALFGYTQHRIYPVRGEYWEVAKSKSHLINALVYPVPDPSGLSLGTHFTRTLWGTLLAGPNARRVSDKNDYEHDREPLDSFLPRARKLLPQLDPDDMRPAHSGIRAKLTPPGERGHGDFVLTRDPAFPRVIHLIGIDSPGLTSAASLARHVAGLLTETLA